MFQRDVSGHALRKVPVHPSRPRLLVENHDPTLSLSDFSAFHDAGLDVVLCSGPDLCGDCSLLASGSCDLAAAADVVLVGLDLDTESARNVLGALRNRHPETPVVVEVRNHQHDALPPGCRSVPFPASVDGQISAVWRALLGKTDPRRPE